MSTTDKIVELLRFYCDAQENANAVLRNGLKELSNPKNETSEMKASIAENRFTVLAWKIEEGSVLKRYQIAVDNQNDPQKWNHAFNILKANGAVIGKRFHEESYQYSYWLYDKMPYKIFRQRLTEAQK